MAAGVNSLYCSSRKPASTPVSKATGVGTGSVLFLCKLSYLAHFLSDSVALRLSAVTPISCSFCLHLGVMDEAGYVYASSCISNIESEEYLASTISIACTTSGALSASIMGL